MRQQTVRYTAAGVVGAALMIGLVVMVNWVSSRHWVRGDWTSSGIYSLSEKTENILASIDKEVKIIVFMTEQTPMYTEVHELIDRYTAASPLITAEYIDPDRERLRTSKLAEQYGVQVADTVVFSCEDRSKYVTADQLAEIDYSAAQYGGAPRFKAFKGEAQFTSSILSIVSTRVPKVYFVTGHGETIITGAKDQQTIAVLDEALKRENMSTAITTLLGGEIPDDADVLAIIAPKQSFTDAELELLAGFLERGGRLLVCLDPLFDAQGTMRTTGLEGLLEDYGVHVNQDVVLDPGASVPGFDASAIFVSSYGDHKITAGLEGVATFFLTALSLEANPGSGWTAVSLAESSDESWGETDLGALRESSELLPGEGDHQGPLTLGLVVEQQQEPAAPAEDEAGSELDASASHRFRLVVFGDGDFLADGVITYPGNKALALNSINWLAEREEVIGIPPREIEHGSGGAAPLSFFVIVLLMPALAILAGILVWWWRRH